MNVERNPGCFCSVRPVLLVGLVAMAVAILGQPHTLAQSSRPSKVVLYASVGPELTQYDVDVETATLIKRSSVMLPENVQEAWPHPSRQYLYVGWSNGTEADHHGLSAFRIDPTSGALRAHGPSVSLSARPIHLTTDVPGAHILVAYRDPSNVTVHRTNRDGTIASQVAAATVLDVGVHGHQVRVDPSNQMVILATLGNDATRDMPEDPGALKIFTYRDGVLANRTSIAPGGGFAFRARHLDFHPSRSWVFVTLESQNKLQVFQRLNGETLSSAPLFSRDTLTDPAKALPEQHAGTVHVHPSGRVVYVANRATDTTSVDGRAVFAGGENTIAVFAIKQGTGEPTLIQNVDTRGIQPRTFALDPTGRILVAANQRPILVREGSGIRTVPASLAVFRVHDDGTLEFVRTYDVAAGDDSLQDARSLLWTGIVALP